ncbi:hypothetical protein TWF696_007539 [Orbilia brochopaga]|uniref:Nucleoside phosphorylase domain-containing protein n=1 Tax=Orbilia brochopaga TaxID=3140254 RepID=A0AAV9UNX1_9PEZI
MSNDLKVWVDSKRHSVEGHTAKCSLSFNGRIIWGPYHCHANTYRLRDALAAADPRFQLTVSERYKSIEGHTYTISVMAGGHLYLDRLSTHGHMVGLCKAINDCLEEERRRAQPPEADPAPPYAAPQPPQPSPKQPVPPRTTRPSGRQDFEIAIICALKVEHDAIEAFLDEEFEIDGFSYGKAPGDFNAYTTGRIGQRAIVLAYMPHMGKVNSATVAAHLSMSFRQIKVALLVGVCGAAPRDANGGEVFLGDVMISTAVIQVDFGRQYSDESVRKDTLEDALGRANPEIRSFLHKLEGDRTSKKLEKKTLEYLTGLCDRDRKYAHPGHSDNLYRADSTHLVPRKREGTARPILHFGRFASGDSVMKSGLHRDKIVAKEQVIAFEMEGAGSWDCLPTVIIKSACDYADSHKNKGWQRYASATAAACTKAVLDEWRSSQVN